MSFTKIPEKPTFITAEDVKRINSSAIKGNSDDVLSYELQSSSYKYLSNNSGLISTQQLDIDWSEFQNHTFFNSAEAKTNIAFDKIINYYPFDGQRSDIENYKSDLTGFENWVLENFPKNIGYLNFDTTNHIIVKDIKGANFPDLSSSPTAESVLDFGTGSFSIEAHFNFPSSANTNEIILQRTTAGKSVNLFLSSSASSTTASVVLSCISGTTEIFNKVNVPKGSFTHLAFTFFGEQGESSIYSYLNGEFVNSSSKSAKIDLSYSGANLTIASGSQFTFNGVSITPTIKLSGSIDELRIWSKCLSDYDIKKNMLRSVCQDGNMKLYFKFNEPNNNFGSSNADQINSVVLDYSGNSLHSYISGFSFSQRITGSSPTTLEKLSDSHVLFGGYSDVAALNSALLADAYTFDRENPNLITKLIPSHYLIEGQAEEGHLTEEGTLSTSQFTSNSIPGSGARGETQAILLLLYSYAKFFDEIKLYIDSFSSLNNLSITGNNKAPSAFLESIMKEYGFEYLSFFKDASIEQHVDGEDIYIDPSQSENSLSSIQNEINRRVLHHIKDLVSSKGTIYSIKSFLRTVGVDPDSGATFKIKEYGGATTKQLGSSYEIRNITIPVLDFNTGTRLTTSYLSSSRSELGFPQITSTSQDGMWTSGSWTHEMFFRFPKEKQYASTTQSLCRLNTTGSSGSFSILNLVATSGTNSDDPSALHLFARPGTDLTTGSSPLLYLTLPANIFNGDVWAVSFGKIRNDQIQSTVSSSYFLKVCPAGETDELNSSTTSSFFVESYTSNVLQQKTVQLNSSGTFLQYGTGSFASSSYFLNNTLLDQKTKTAYFEGQISKPRFWSKAVNEENWKYHRQNPLNIGDTDLNNTIYTFSGSNASFEKIRMSLDFDQETLETDGLGSLTIVDTISKHDALLTSSNLNSTMFSGSIIRIKSIDNDFDENVSNDKVRIRSYIDSTRVKDVWTQSGPVYSTVPTEDGYDDSRLSIEFSIVDSLDKDILTIFSTLTDLDNIVGSPELLFCDSYPDMERLREKYFERLTDKINFRGFFSFFRWFDSSIGNFIEKLIPNKTNYLGTNFVIEPHILERSKVKYANANQYMNSEKFSARNVLLFEQAAPSSIKKY